MFDMKNYIEIFKYMMKYDFLFQGNTFTKWPSMMEGGGDMVKIAKCKSKATFCPICISVLIICGMI